MTRIGMLSNGASLINRLNAEYLCYRAQTLGEGERWEESLRAYEEGLALDPTNWGLRLHYGLTLARTFDYVGANVQLEQAQRLRPNNSVIPMFWGGVLIEQGSHEDALRLINKSLGMDPSNWIALALKGLALLYCGNRNQG